MRRNAESEPIVTEFRPTMDPHSLEIVREGKRLGNLLWHNGEARVEFPTPDALLTVPVDILESIVRRSKLALSGIPVTQPVEPLTADEIRNPFIRDILL
jgi:hypothetical protein